MRIYVPAPVPTALAIRLKRTPMEQALLLLNQVFGVFLVPHFNQIVATQAYMAGIEDIAGKCAFLIDLCQNSFVHPYMDIDYPHPIQC